MIDRLNYHHLRYFYRVATEGHLSRAAERLNVSQSSLSIQIRQLEERLGLPLFERVGRRMELTEAGRIAMDHAARIFEAGDELLATLQQSQDVAPPLRIGALSTLSRNFQMRFLAPVLEDRSCPVALKSGNMGGLLKDLEAMDLDVVLTTQIPTDHPHLAAQRIDQQPVQIHGTPDLVRFDKLSDLLAHAPLILPTDNVVRAGFQALVTRLGITPNIVADVDDMAMVRLLARAGLAAAVAPAVVVADEVAAGTLITAPFDLQIEEPFYAVTKPRSYPHPRLAALLQQHQS